MGKTTTSNKKQNTTIFEFHYKSDNQKDWVKAPDRKEAIYFIMSQTHLSFGEIIKYCKIRKLTLQEEKEFMVYGEDNKTAMSFYDYAQSAFDVDYIASTAFYL